MSEDPKLDENTILPEQQPVHTQEDQSINSLIKPFPTNKSKNCSNNQKNKEISLNSSYTKTRV